MKQQHRSPRRLALFSLLIIMVGMISRIHAAEDNPPPTTANTDENKADNTPPPKEGPRSCEGEDETCQVRIVTEEELAT